LMGGFTPTRPDAKRLGNYTEKRKGKGALYPKKGTDGNSLRFDSY